MKETPVLPLTPNPQLFELDPQSKDDANVRRELGYGSGKTTGLKTRADDRLGWLHDAYEALEDAFQPGGVTGDRFEIKAGELLDRPFDQIEADLEGSPHQLRALAFASAARAFVAVHRRDVVGHPFDDGFALAKPYLLGSEIDSAFAKPAAVYRPQSLPLDTYRAVGLKPELIAFLEKLDAIGSRSDGTEARGYITRNDLLTYEKHSMLPSEKAEAEPLLRAAWALLAVVQTEPFTTQESLPTIHPVVSERFESPDKEHLIDETVAIDNLDEKLTTFAKRAAHVARTHGISAGASDNRLNKDPSLLTLRQVRSAADADRATTREERNVFKGDLEKAMLDWLPDSKALVAQVVLEPPGDKGSTTVYSTMKGGAEIAVSSTLTYEGRHQVPHLRASSDVHELWARRSYELHAEIPAGHVMVLQRMSVGELLEVPVLLDESGTFNAPPGAYEIFVLDEDGRTVSQGALEMPRTDPSFSDLTRYVGYELAFSDGPAKVVAEDSGDVTRTELRRAPKAKKKRGSNSLIEVLRNQGRVPDEHFEPGRYDIELPEDERLLLDMFPGGLVRATVVGEDFRDTEIIIGAGELCDGKLLRSASELLFDLSMGQIRVTTKKDGGAQTESTIDLEDLKPIG